jgi:hypothetical protein
MPSFEFFTCILCKERKVYDYAYQQEVDICDGCAGWIANNWHYSHSGEYLIGNERREPSRPAKKPIPTKLRWQVFKRDGYVCVECSSEHDLTADHKYPESIDGEATLENLQTLCRSCNSRKGVSHAA